MILKTETWFSKPWDQKPTAVSHWFPTSSPLVRGDQLSTTCAPMEVTTFTVYPLNAFRDLQRYGAALPSPLPIQNHFAGAAFTVSYLSGNHRMAWCEAEHPPPGRCPAHRLVPCLCCLLHGKFSASGHNSVLVPNVSLCPIKALEIHEVNIWGILGSSHISGHCISHIYVLL